MGNKDLSPAQKKELLNKETLFLIPYGGEIFLIFGIVLLTLSAFLISTPLWTIGTLMAIVGIGLVMYGEKISSKGRK
ncbi:MAG: hypothetical protein O2U61_05180 [Candidatus Bathyarchaeota archaeon]|nr:hypothetical protein [Candidatus Bathyarchaeota archaeon]